MEYLKVFWMMGEMVLLFIGMVLIWYICHIVRPIAGYYLNFYITKWLGWHEKGQDWLDEEE